MIDEKLKVAANYLDSGFFDKAQVVYNEIINIEPENELALVRLAIISLNKQDYNQALDYLHRVCAINPSAAYFTEIANVYFDIKDYANAVNHYLKAIDSGDSSHDNFFNLALCHFHNGHYEESISILNHLALVKPDDPEIYYNIALNLSEKADFENAKLFADRAIAIKPDYPDAQFLLSTLLLANEEYKKGFELYEWRFFKKNAVEMVNFNKPRWNGEFDKDKTIYVYHEQGYGDSIMFARFIPLLAEKFKKVLFKPQSGLEKLFSDSGLSADIINNKVPGTELEFDCYIQLMSLAKILDINIETIPSKEGYIKADPEIVKRYKEKYFDNSFYKIGLAWQSNPNVAQKRSLELKYLIKLANTDNIKLYSLQKGYGTEQINDLNDSSIITELGSGFSDFSDTAAAIANLDLVITIDTSIAHLAGAMGKNTAVLLPYIANWK